MFQGCSSPLVVKLADTQRVKDQKGLLASAGSLLSPSMADCVAQNAQQYITVILVSSRRFILD
jgi:hypothetical protein